MVAVGERRWLHCADGPAFAWLDDIREFYWHGINVPDFVIERPREIAVEHINAEQNSEVRRVMIERYRLGDEIHGAGAFMRDAGGQRLDHDERFGTLWRRDVKNEEPWEEVQMSSATVRVTVVYYIDEQGEKQLELSGWGPSIPGIIDSGIEPNFLLGQVWVERPYRTLADAPRKLTVVDLRSSDGNRRMLQEFVGHIADRTQISELLSQRLGTDLSKWRPVDVAQFELTK